jgi:hypothetical protein
MKYITVNPSKGVGIGHQLLNYNCGLILSKLTNTEFIHEPFESKRSLDSKAETWESFLNLHSLYKQRKDLEQVKTLNIQNTDFGYFKNKINKQTAESNLSNILKLINNTPDNTLIELARNQYPGIIAEYSPLIFNDLRKAYFEKNKKQRTNQIVIAMHIRRGDIGNSKNILIKGRWLEDQYYLDWINFFNETLSDKNIVIKIYSEGNPSNFSNLKKDNVELVLGGNPRNAFHAFCTCDILVVGLSTFSNKAALINNNFRILYPLMTQNDWVNHIDNPESSNTMMYDDPKEKLKQFLNLNYG